MQLIQNGPDIPDRLMQAHEEGQVVFFCGAGISYPAGLPSFKGLISKLYARLCMKADDAFPDAVNLLKPWLSTATQSDVTLSEFEKTDLAKRFPEPALAFLDTILAENSFYLANDLRKILKSIREASPNLENDVRYERLTRYARQKGS